MTVPSTKWKRKKAKLMAEVTGLRFCMSCMTMKPADTVHKYHGVQRGMVLRCDVCQAGRVAALQSRRAA